MAAVAFATTLVFAAPFGAAAASWCQATTDGSCAGVLHTFQKGSVPYRLAPLGPSWLKGQTRFRFADWDGDGDTDILTGESANNETDWIWLYEQLSNGSFSKQELVEVDLVKDEWSFEVVDWDGD